MTFFTTFHLRCLVEFWIHLWIKNIREFSWMPHRVIRFWFLLSFLFISAFFDILARLSISRVFQGRRKSSWLDIPRTVVKCDYMNEFNVRETFLSYYKHFSCLSSCLLLLLEVRKYHYRKENSSFGSSKQGRETLFKFIYERLS